jgi:hypothetical protein
MTLTTAYRNGGIEVSCGRDAYDCRTSGMSDDETFLRSLAASVVTGCGFTVSAGPFEGKTLYSPGVNGNYYGYNMVIRDQVMMMRGAPGLFTAQGMADIVDAIASCSDQGHGNHIVEGIDNEGGYHDYGWAGAGSGAIVVDESYEFVDAIYSHFLKTGLATKFTEHEVACINALHAQATDNHLVYLSDEESDRVGFGFVDSITIRGHHLYCSLQRIRSMRQVIEMLTALGRTMDYDDNSVAWYNSEIDAASAALVTHLWDSERGLFKFGTLQNTAQHDVPGSALAVVMGVVSPEIATAISDALFAMLPGGTNAANGCFLNGQVRNFPLDDPYFTVMRSGIPQDAYQNGGYWGTHTAHAAKAIDYAHPGSGATLMHAWANKCRADGANAPVEAEGGSWSYSYPYGANAALPLQYFDTIFNR